MIKVSMNQESASSHPAYLKGADLSIRAFQNFRKGVKAFFKDKEPRYDSRQFFMTLQTSQMPYSIPLRQSSMWITCTLSKRAII